MAHGRRALGARLALVAAAVLSLAWALAAILAVDPGADQPTTYAAAFTAARFADVAAGLGLVAAGAFALTQPQARRLGLLAMLAGIAWLGADWEGADGPALLQSLGAVTAPFTIVLVLHLALALPTGRVRSPWPGPSSLWRTRSPRQSAQAARSSAIRCSTSIAGAAATKTCSWSTPTRESQARSPTSGSGRRSRLGLALLAVAAHRLVAPPGPQGEVLLPVLGPALLVGASEAAYALALLRTPLEDPERTGFAAIFLARSFGLAALALGLAWSVLRIPRTRARVARLASELGEAPPPGKLREALVGCARRPRHRCRLPAQRLGAAHRRQWPAHLAPGRRPRGRPDHARRAHPRARCARSCTR